MTSRQTDYRPHNADDLGEGWVAVREYLDGAILIAWDECHKMYLAMDEGQAEFFRENYPLTLEGEGVAEMLRALGEWWDASCDLRFVQAVWTDENDPNAGFVTLISQFAEGE